MISVAHQSVAGTASTPTASVPLNVVIGYWNFVLDPGVVEYAFGIVTLLLNAILLWPWRRELIGLLRW
ncbi:MAG: hypothetical protein V4521_16515 [Pseudomonadota bacterium]